MALVTAQLMWIAPGVVISATIDTTTEVATALVIDNPTTKPVTISVRGTTGVVNKVIEPGSLDVLIDAVAEPALTTIGTVTSWAGMV